jgi:hypothetical protein
MRAAAAATGEGRGSSSPSLPEAEEVFSPPETEQTKGAFAAARFIVSANMSVKLASASMLGTGSSSEEGDSRYFFRRASPSSV